MNINYIDGLIMPIITACALCTGYVMKKWLPTDDRWIPTTLLILGALSGLLLFGLDYEGIVKGMVSGLAAVGLHQAFKQHLKLTIGEDEIYAMGPGEDLLDDCVSQEPEVYQDEEVLDDEQL